MLFLSPLQITALLFSPSCSSIDLTQLRWPLRMARVLPVPPPPPQKKCSFKLWFKTIFLTMEKQLAGSLRQSELLFLGCDPLLWQCNTEVFNHFCVALHSSACKEEVVSLKPRNSSLRLTVCCSTMIGKVFLKFSWKRQGWVFYWFDYPWFSASTGVLGTCFLA